MSTASYSRGSYQTRQANARSRSYDSVNSQSRSSYASRGYANASSAYSSASRGYTNSSRGYTNAPYISTSAAPELEPDWSPSVSVIQGTGRNVESAGLSASLLTLAKLCTVVCIVLALVSVARVTIISASAACALETKTIQNNISEARTQGNSLEVQQSVLSNPTRIKARALALGMASPTEDNTDYLTLDPDVMVTDAQGNLSLSESVEAAAQAKAQGSSKAATQTASDTASDAATQTSADTASDAATQTSADTASDAATTTTSTSERS